MVNTTQQDASVYFTVLLTVFLLSLFLSSAKASANQKDNHCDYSSQLTEPAALNKFLEMKAEMEFIARIRKESLETGKSDSTPDELASYRLLDEHSKECIGCHRQKGKMAVREIIESYYPPINSAMNAIYATHAIGTDYVAASIRNAGLRPLEDLPATMTLVNGRIACITCHNPLNMQQNSLAVDKQGSTLCFSCHKY
jgi:predicted CXXCH cytochrome family protein